MPIIMIRILNKAFHESLSSFPINYPLPLNAHLCIFLIFEFVYPGKIFEKDFDIRKEAGGDSFVVVQKEYNAAQVSENYLEIHLF